jgi:hypothetical protein
MLQSRNCVVNNVQNWMIPATRTIISEMSLRLDLGDIPKFTNMKPSPTDWRFDANDF